MALGIQCLQCLLRRKTVSWGDGSVGRVLAMQTRDLVRSPSIHVKEKKSWASWHVCITPVLGDRDSGILEAHWPASLVETVSSRFSGRPGLKI